MTFLKYLESFATYHGDSYFPSLEEREQWRIDGTVTGLSSHEEGPS